MNNPDELAEIGLLRLRLVLGAPGFEIFERKIERVRGQIDAEPGIETALAHHATRHRGVAATEIEYATPGSYPFRNQSLVGAQILHWPSSRAMRAKSPE